MDKGEVAARMGLKGKGRHNLITRLETGKVPNPYLSTITRYLRACGAQFFEFYDTLTRIEPVPVDTRPIERAPMKREQKEMLLRRVKREVYNYQDETSYPKRGKPIAPEKQKPAAAKLADYRVQDAKSLEQPEPAGDSPWFRGTKPGQSLRKPGESRVFGTVPDFARSRVRLPTTSGRTG